ncbi:transposase IS1239 [Streptococcus canis FSL Z3-227]|uniref:Transposase IS1239 n=1 Tax=Streptococcus canis FSL Z3-227 TaxID=482234 RepID=A0AAV3FPR0_STRCB|nr:transposase IS1239 [Streptococcus canis FSL Z3-227]GFE44613.1 hypothetical protein ScFU6_03820 [Streptococcus canis]VEE24108.1 transposase IS1239 [Streptococcus canis]VTS71478.1 transposase IS1239 [Streptococcus canis]
MAKAPQTIHNEVKRGQVRQQVRQGKYEQVYSADFAQEVYDNNRKRSVKQVTLTKELKEKIVHYIKQKYSPEMMVKAKGVNVPISTIYYWIHHGQLGLTKADRLYPRKEKAKKKQASPNFKPAGKSIEERPESINNREHSGDFEIDTVIQTRAKNECLLTLTDRKSRYQIIRLIPDKSASSVNQALKSILKVYQINSITADNGTEFSCLQKFLTLKTFTMPTPIPLEREEQMKIITDSFGVGYQREVKMRLNNKSHLLKMGLITTQRNYLITNLLKSFYRLANLHLKFGIRLGKPLIS